MLSASQTGRVFHFCSSLCFWSHSEVLALEKLGFPLLFVPCYTRAMTDTARELPFTETEYLAFDRESEVRHEFNDGVLWAMSGGKIKHNDIAFNITAILKEAARPRGCRVTMENIKVRAGRAYFLPDVAVTCEPRSGEDDILEHPCALFEVLSPSTETRDRTLKLEAYTRTISSLEQYALVSSERRYVELYTRAGSGLWTYQSFAQGEEFTVSCLQTTLSLEQIYRFVDLKAEPDE
ncbi:MAG: Uma2 family endonuclease [Pseudopedobacter sp.]|nr:Uma2 family endonuclease [Deinococcales bacterium]